MLFTLLQLKLVKLAEKLKDSRMNTSSNENTDPRVANANGR